MKDDIEKVFSKYGWRQVDTNFWFYSGPNCAYGMIAWIKNNWVTFYHGLELVIHTPHRDFIKVAIGKDFYDELDEVIRIDGDR